MKEQFASVQRTEVKTIWRYHNRNSRRTDRLLVGEVRRRRVEGRIGSTNNKSTSLIKIVLTELNDTKRSHPLSPNKVTVMHQF